MKRMTGLLADQVKFYTIYQIACMRWGANFKLYASYRGANFKLYASYSGSNVGYVGIGMQ